MKISDLLKHKKLLVSDGAWGTFFFLKGLKTGQCSELWNLTNPDLVEEIAQSYIHAGADIIETNSFGGNRFKLDQYGLSEKVYEINRLAAEISRKAAGEKIVMASIGPTGKFLMMDDITETELYDSFKEQATAFEEGGADAVIIETFYDLEEARVAINAVRENTELEIVCSFTYEKGNDSLYHTMMGISPEEAMNFCITQNVDIVGTNCGSGFDNMIEIVEVYRKVNKGIPILTQANAGMPVLKDDKLFYPESPEYMSRVIPQIINAGANIIGGCCGTTPDHIRKIREVVDSVNQ